MGGADALPLKDSGIRPPADPFVLFWDIHFWWRTLNFSKGTVGANIY